KAESLINTGEDSMKHRVQTGSTADPGSLLSRPSTGCTPENMASPRSSSKVSPTESAGTENGNAEQHNLQTLAETSEKDSASERHWVSTSSANEDGAAMSGNKGEA
ncbi:unnamed protein product, partial [Amoebophrya sp. A120]